MVFWNCCSFPWLIPVAVLAKPCIPPRPDIATQTEQLIQSGPSHNPRPYRLKERIVQQIHPREELLHRRIEIQELLGQLRILESLHQYLLQLGIQSRPSLDVRQLSLSQHASA